jgi:glycine cleavage system transcriptional repressor
MSKYIALTAIGRDRTGIISSIAKVLCEERCNIEESTMTILQGQFAMILIVKISEKLAISNLLKKLTVQAKSFGMAISYNPLVSFVRKKKSGLNRFIISVYGADNIGIVYNVCKCLSDSKINIVGMQTKLSKNNKKSVYIMLIESEFPKKLSTEKISLALSKLAQDLNVSISLNQAENSNI